MLSDSTLSFHHVELSARYSGAAAAGACFLYIGNVVSGSTIEVTGGSIAVAQSGIVDGNIVDLMSSTVNMGSIFRTNGTTISCQSTGRMCAAWRLTESKMTSATVAFFGSSLTLRSGGGAMSAIWVVDGSSARLDRVSLIHSRSNSQLGSTSSRILYSNGGADIRTGTTLYWHYSTASRQLYASYKCDGTACPELVTLINNAATPQMPNACPYCLAPYGDPVPYDDGRGHDFGAAVGCRPWAPTASSTPRHTPADLAKFFTLSESRTCTASHTDTQEADANETDGNGTTIDGSGSFTHSKFTNNDTFTKENSPQQTGLTTNTRPLLASASMEEEAQRHSRSTATASDVRSRTITEKTDSVPALGRSTAKTESKSSQSRTKGRRRPPRGVPFVDYPFVFRGNPRRDL